MKHKHTSEPTWKDFMRYAKAYKQGRVPDWCIEESIVTMQYITLFGTVEIPLPHLDHLKDALASLKPKKHWWDKQRKKKKRETKNRSPLASPFMWQCRERLRIADEFGISWDEADKILQDRIKRGEYDD